MSGTVGILNVGAGDTKLTFDKSNPAETIRAARIVKDMLRRGYALLVDVGDGKYQRAKDFDENTAEYIIADFDPVQAAVCTCPTDGVSESCAIHGPLKKGTGDGKGSAAQEDRPDAGTGDAAPGRKAGKAGRRRIPAASTRAVAVGRTAGG